ncbi:type II secretion system protein [Nocardioides sp. GY 10113]|uniref:type II secretion system protein n=1 Tax=Nocardioides sp. GY 10113 TaxID=2569761 RepID=UPI0010A8866C|nr:type II secretion system protein [Nocardioides sp. GY 10113]TIC88842.1 type II secretion system protein [Nocardioides sp. GY 10113]
MLAPLRSRLRAARGADDGVTLIETLVAVAILGIAAVAILAGLQTSVKVSDVHSKAAAGGATVRSLAEAIQEYVARNPANYRACAAADHYTDPTRVPASAYGLDDVSYEASQTRARRWNGSAWTDDCTAGNDLGLQQVELTVTSVDGRAEESMTLVLRRPCDGSGSDACA